jgi:hypothetical protein
VKAQEKFRYRANPSRALGNFSIRLLVSPRENPYTPVGPALLYIFLFCVVGYFSYGSLGQNRVGPGGVVRVAWRHSPASSFGSGLVTALEQIAPKP